MYLTYAEFQALYPDYDMSQAQFAVAEPKSEVDINGLTFCRINSAEFDALTARQKDLVQRATAMQIIFCNDNADLLDSVLTSYSVAGISMSFDRSKIVQCDGVITSRQAYSTLMQTGLCYRGIG